MLVTFATYTVIMKKELDGAFEDLYQKDLRTQPDNQPRPSSPAWRFLAFSKINLIEFHGNQL